MTSGDVISYLDACREENVSLQRGMNFRLHGRRSVILMNVRPGAPYADRIEDGGRVLIYEGHDVPRVRGGRDPKTVDQLLTSRGGALTQNGLFRQAAEAFKRGDRPAELVRVYEKLRPGIWVFNGVFRLVDAWWEVSNSRHVLKLRLMLAIDLEDVSPETATEIEHSRLIPTTVKLEVWKRDKGRCVVCGSQDNLHFDHIIPYSRGGSSLVSENIQLLCARHNLEKRDRIA